MNLLYDKYSKYKLLKLYISLLSIESTTNHEEKIYKYIKCIIKKQIATSKNKYLKRIEELYNKNNTYALLLNFNKPQTILLAAHLDTVPPFFPPKTQKGKIFARGSIDTKAGLSYMLYIISYLLNNNTNPNYNLIFVFYSKEEGPLPNGLTYFINEQKTFLKNTKPRFSIIFEPTNNKILIGTFFTLSLSIEIRSKNYPSGHSAFPEKAKNIINDIPEIITLLQDSLTISWNKYNKNNQNLTFTITQVITPSPKNVIPNQINFTLNIRGNPIKIGNTLTKIQKTLIKDFKKHTNKLKTKYKIKLNIIDWAPGTITNLKKLPKHIQPKIKQDKFFRAWCDISQLVPLKIPTIIFGPGKTYLAHSIKENLSTKELIIGIQKLFEIIKGL